MKYIFSSVLVLILLTSCKEIQKSDSKNGIAQTETIIANNADEVTITPIEHATAVLQWGETTIYIDPVGGAEAFKNKKKPDLILISDIHGDHFNLETLDFLDTSKAKIILPQAVANKMPDNYIPQLDVLNNGESKERYGITVEAIPMYNLREEALNFHTKGRGNGYILSKGKQRIYFSGDTEDIPEMRALENIDKAFICMNLPYTMTVESAVSAVLAFEPKEVYPYHYRGKPEVSEVAKFKKLVNEINPQIKVIQLDWYPVSEY
jgi:L-ascorbate metabolism protein UlaG (beta-lactamase superfamily)